MVVVGIQNGGKGNNVFLRNVSCSTFNNDVSCVVIFTEKKDILYFAHAVRTATSVVVLVASTVLH